jgi:dipeptidyl aminopeptidase/acylaminoacyl peptidase
MFRSLAGLGALMLAGVAPLVVHAQAPAPAAAYARLPAVQFAEISPDGQKIAILGGTFDNRTITINPIDGQQAVTIPLGAVDVSALRWAGDNNVVATVRVFDSRTNFNDGRTYSYNLQRDIVFDMKGQILGLLLDGHNWSGFATERPILGDIDGDKPAVAMLGLSEGAPIGDQWSKLKQKSAGLVPAIYRVDVLSGNGRITEKGSEATRHFEVDRKGEARVRIDSAQGFTSLWTRRKGAATWTEQDRSPSMELKVALIGYSDAEDAVYLRAETQAGAQVIRLNLADNSRTVVGPASAARDAELMQDPRTGQAVAIVTGLEKPEYQWLDPKLGAVHARISKALKNRHVQVVSWSADRGRIILRADAPNAPPAWYLYEVATNQASQLGDEYPELAGASFGKTSWLTYKAADGLEMFAYLTVPANLPAGRKAPLIVMPHGGPDARDEYEFDWLEQFLVSRGYAVLKPQFRGSDGFGEAFRRAGFTEWGGKMQSDVADAIGAVSDPAVDTGRACILGWSFGGYAALHGATHRSDRYRCAVSINGVSDLRTMLGHARIYTGAQSNTIRYLQEVIGDPRVDARALDRASPYRSVGGRTAPVLLVYAAHDTTVPIDQSKLMASSLTDAGVPHQVLVIEGDDHHLSSSKSRLQTLQATEAFLAKYLPIAP